jgi:replicative DNA helicase Mcm
MASGLGASSAGLTVSVSKDKSGSWGVEAGAMALADEGVLCLDEINLLGRKE